MRMERLISVLEGEAKVSVEPIGCNGIFYGTALKSLTRDFGNHVLVSHLKIKWPLEQLQLKPNNKTGLWHYPQQIKTTNTWLISVGCQNPILSYGNLSKAVARLSHYLCTQFFRATRDCNLTDGTIKLLPFEDWPEKRVKDQFNSLALQEANLKQNQSSKDHLYKNRLHSNLISKDTQQNNKHKKEEPSKPKDNKEKLMCWLCEDKRSLMDCSQFKKMSVTERIDFVTKQRLCKNCFSKTHVIKEGICKWKCRANGNGKKHHTLLHQDNTQ